MWQAPRHLIPTLPADNGGPALPAAARQLEEMGIPGTGYTGEQAGLLLAARDLADCVMGSATPPGWTREEARLVLVNYAIAQLDHAWLRSWPSARPDRHGDTAGGLQDSRRLLLEELFRVMLHDLPELESCHHRPESGHKHHD